MDKPNLLQRLCATYVERANYHGLKGKRRDDDLIAFMSGAACALADAGLQENAEWIGRVNLMLFSTRGYAECKRIADEAPTTAQEKDDD